MRTISYRLEDLKKVTIHIGYVGENEHTRVNIDAGEVFADNPDAVVTMKMQPPRGTAYPVTVSRDGDIVTWDVKNSDLVSRGAGEIQLTFTENTEVIKSCIARINIDRSIVGSGTVPDPVQDWIDDATEKLAAVEEATTDAETAAGKIDDMTVAASGSAYGTTPTATITEVEGHKHVAFTIPAGQPGTPGDPTQLIDDTAGAGTTGKTWSANKLNDQFGGVLNDIGEMNTATASDVGKALSPKTVSNGKVTEWQFVEGGGISTFGRRTAAIFKKVCCIGDSYTAGYIYNTSGTAHSDNDYSWVEHMKKITGRDYVNCGVSGATTESWLSSANGLAKAQNAGNKAQAYIIGLQINDASTGLSVGTTADIGTNAQTYYGYTSKIIDDMFTVNDDAHIFLLTQPKNYTGIHTPYREAILNIVSWYQNENNGTHQNQVHLIDLLDYYKLFQGAGCNDSMANGHYTAVGWEYVAEIILYAWSNYINANPLKFQDVNLIEYGTPIPCTAISLSESSVSFSTLSDTEQITATLTPNDTTDTVEWNTSNANVATVVNGLITAIGTGTATITAICGNQTATVSVAVEGSQVAVPKYDWTSASRVSDGYPKYKVNTNYYQLTAFGYSTQATTYKINNDTADTVTSPYAIKLPTGTAQIKITATNHNIFYNGANSRIIWTKDEPSGVQGIPADIIKALQQDDVNLSTGAYTANVPSGADSVLIMFRLDAAKTSYSSNPDGFASDNSILIEFLPAST